MNEIRPLFDDDRTIVKVVKGKAVWHTRQPYGYTKIIAYRECGQMAYVPWLAFYVGDELRFRMDAAGCYIEYEEGQ